MQNALARVQNPALRQGLIFGIILGIVLLAISFIGFNNWIFTSILCFLAAFLAGRRASQENEKIITGIFAGLCTGFLGTFIPSIILMFLFLINIDKYRENAQAIANQQHLHTTYTNSLLIEGLLISVLILLILGILPGVLGGLLGGVFGTRRVQNPPVEEHKEAIFEPPSETPTEKPLPAPEKEEPPSETPSEEPTSLGQQAE